MYNGKLFLLSLCDKANKVKKKLIYLFKYLIVNDQKRSNDAIMFCLVQKLFTLP